MTRDEYRQAIGRWLKRERAYRISQAKVCAAVKRQGIKLSPSKLSRIERGEEGIELEELLALLAVYDKSLADIFAGIVPLEEPLSATRASSNGERQRQAA